MSHSLATMLKPCCRAFVLGLALLCAANPHAATCSVTSAILSFGQYSGLAGSPSDVPGLIRVTCTKDAVLATEVVTLTVRLLLSPLAAGGGRKLLSGSAELPFFTYTDLLRTRVWGDGTGGSFTISGVLTLTALNTPSVIEFPVYGRLPSGSASPSGNYTGQFAISVDY